MSILPDFLFLGRASAEIGWFHPLHEVRIATPQLDGNRTLRVLAHLWQLYHLLLAWLFLDPKATLLRLPLDLGGLAVLQKELAPFFTLFLVPV